MPPFQQFYRAIYAYPWDLVHEEPLRFGEIVSAQRSPEWLCPSIVVFWRQTG